MKGLWCIKLFLITALLFTCALTSHAQSEDEIQTVELRDTTSIKENTRVVAIGLNIALGLFGVHRMYLGTDVKVPVFYTLTVGGGGVLWLIDLGCLIFSKDLEPFKNNPHIFMWTTEELKQKSP